MASIKTTAVASVVEIDMPTPNYIPRRRPRPASGREGLLRAVLQGLHADGYLVLRPQSALSSRWGAADLVALGQGRCLFVVLGPVPARMSRRRQHFAENVRRAGGELVVVRGNEDLARLRSARGAQAQPAHGSAQPKRAEALGEGTRKALSPARAARPVFAFVRPRRSGSTAGEERGSPAAAR